MRIQTILKLIWVPVDTERCGNPPQLIRILSVTTKRILEIQIPSKYLVSPLSLHSRLLKPGSEMRVWHGSRISLISCIATISLN